MYGGLAAFNLSLNLVLIPRFGILGAAIATFLTFGLYALVTLSLARRYCPIEWDRRVIWKSLLAGLGLAAMLSILKTSSAAGLLAVAAAAVILYIVSLAFLHVLTRQELSLFRELGFGWARKAVPVAVLGSG
jgi:O-antigen/teichoic acid export membrane protein